MKKKLLMGIMMTTLSMGLLTGCGEKEQRYEDVAPPETIEESTEAALEVETEEQVTEVVETETEAIPEEVVENENTVIEVNEVTLTFKGDAETVSMKGGSTVVFTIFDDEMNMSRANVSVFEASDYTEQIQMVKEKNHENTDVNGNAYWTATHTEENTVFAAYEDEKFIVISWEGDESILDKIEYCLN